MGEGRERGRKIGNYLKGEIKKCGRESSFALLPTMTNICI